MLCHESDNLSFDSLGIVTDNHLTPLPLDQRHGQLLWFLGLPLPVDCKDYFFFICGY